MGARTVAGLAIALAAVGSSCAPTGDRQPGASGSEPASGVQTERPAAVPELEMLPAPFSADQLREEWVPGLRVEMRRWSPSGEAFERWLVVAADADGVEMAITRLDAAGSPAGEPETRRSSWAELRDHARYPVSLATRRRDTRTTRLGDLEGWLYTLDDPKSGTTSELFFADTMPGAPLEMVVRSGEEVVFRLEQTVRERAGAAAGE